MNGFEFACGSVIGRDHREANKNNHDSGHWHIASDFSVAVVCDGCGSGKHSEVGAAIGARLVVAAIVNTIGKFKSSDSKDRLGGYPFWERVRQDVLAEMRVLINRMGGSFSETVKDYFLFTVVGAVLSPVGVSFFSLGDGIVIVNGAIVRLGPFPRNEPPYLAYALVENSVIDPKGVEFNIVSHHEIGTINSFLLGTDGVGDLIEAADTKVPGKDELVGPINQFWTDDRFFSNPFMIGRRLALIGRDTQTIDWKRQKMERENGILKDDTTLIVGRRQGG